jgi:uncharacterized protein DUF5134
VAGGGRLALGHHALMMAGMAWMVLAMPGITTAASGSGEQATMAGMPTGGQAPMGGSAPMHVVAVAAVLAVIFLVAGIGWVTRAIDGGRTSTLRVRTVGVTADGVMSLGMALMAALRI